jgi:tRNA (guanine-N7-)-methyltransferase
MNKELKYLPYRSRRNKIIKNDISLNLIDYYSYDRQKEFILNTNKKINLEIGFGSGEFIFYRAKRDKENIYVGSEVYNPGIVKLINNINRNNIDNVFIYQGDVRDLLNHIPNQFFYNIYILFPDPWPKKKHHKRRLINKSFLQYLFDKFSSNLFIVTDHANYAENILHDILKNDEIKLDKMKISNKVFFKTNFEAKALQKSNNIFNFALSHKNK